MFAFYPVFGRAVCFCDKMEWLWLAVQGFCANCAVVNIAQEATACKVKISNRGGAVCSQGALTFFESVSSFSITLSGGGSGSFTTLVK